MNFIFHMLIRFQTLLQYIQRPSGIQVFIHKFTLIFKNCIINSTCWEIWEKFVTRIRSNRLFITEIISCLYYVDTKLLRVIFSNLEVFVCSLLVGYIWLKWSLYIRNYNINIYFYERNFSWRYMCSIQFNGSLLIFEKSGSVTCITNQIGVKKIIASQPGKNG